MSKIEHTPASLTPRKTAAAPGKTTKHQGRPASERVAASCNDPSLQVHTTSPALGRGHVVLKGGACCTGFVPSFLSVTLPAYQVWNASKGAKDTVPAQKLTVGLSGGETSKEAAEKLATRINRETGFQAEVHKVAGGYSVAVSDKLRAL